MDRAAFTLDRPQSGKLASRVASPQDSNKTGTPLQEKESSRAQAKSPMNLEAPAEKGRPHSR